MSDNLVLSTADEDVSTSKNLNVSRTRSPVRTKRKRTNAEVEDLDNPGKKNTVDDKRGVNFDLKPRWRRVAVRDVDQDSSDETTERIACHPQCRCQPSEIKLKNSAIDDASESQSHSIPKTPTFRRTAAHPHKEELHGDSPACVVSGPNIYDDLYLCHRSLAWSDDDWSDDESTDHQDKGCAFVRRKGDVLPTRHLLANGASPTHGSNGNYFYPPQLFEKDNLDGQPLAVSLHQYPDSPQNTSEIFWEEKVLDVLDLERMARLSI